jgi:hypothetical protein
MKKTSCIAAAAVCISLFASHGAAAKTKLCNLTGNWTDELGATAVIKGKKGTATASAICATGTYTLKITDLTATGFDITGKTKDKSCPGVTAALAFVNGNCAVASGTITIGGSEILDDEWTNNGSADIVRRANAVSSKLTDGLR